jgi:hypothetical protein
VLSPKEAAEKRLRDIEDNQKRLDTAQRAANQLNAFKDKVLAYAESWQTAARIVGSAYKLAANNHQKALADQARDDALRVQLMFSILTVVASGALGWVINVAQQNRINVLERARWRLQRAKETNRWVLVPGLSEDFLRKMPTPERRLLIAAGEEMVKAGAGETLSALGPMTVDTSKESVSEDPQVFQNQRENAVGEVKEKLLLRFSSVHATWAAAPLASWDTYDADTQQAWYEGWLADADQLAGADQLPSMETLAAEFERGIWAKWMPSLKHLNVNHPQYQLSDEKYDGVGSSIGERFEQLGILRMAGVSLHWYQFAATEDKPLIAWAAGYRPKDYATLKANETQGPKSHPKDS